MPELVPAWQRLTAMIDGPGAGASAGAALALWNPPSFLPDARKQWSRTADRH